MEKLTNFEMLVFRTTETLTQLFLSKVLIISDNLPGILNFCCRVNKEYVSSLNHKLYNLKCPVLVVLKLCKNNYFTNTLVMSTKSRKVSLNHKFKVCSISSIETVQKQLYSL